VYEICLYSVLKCSNLFHLQKMQQSFAALSPAAQAEVTSIMTEPHQFANVVTLNSARK
jgi:hypothetical protein